MSCSTHAGFSGPELLYSWRASELPAVRACSMSPSVCIDAVGVGQRLTAVDRPSSLVALAPFLLWFPHTVGVGHAIFTAIVSGVPIPLPLIPVAAIRARRASNDSTLSDMLNIPTSGVGHNEQPFPSVRAPTSEAR